MVQTILSKPRDLRHLGAKVLAGCLLLGGFLLPQLWWQGYWPVLSTGLLLLLLYTCLRAWFAGALGFRAYPDPPAPGDGSAWPSIDVIVPAYNEGTVLPLTLGALRAADYPGRLRVLCIYETRSTDQTAAAVQAAAQADPRLVALPRSGRPGKSAALNDALRLCRADLVVCLDADQVLAPGGLRRVAQWFLADPGLTCLKGRPIGHNVRASVWTLLGQIERDTIERGDTYARTLLSTFTFFSGGQVAFRRSLLDRLGPFDEGTILEDFEYSVRIHQAGHAVRMDPGFITHEEHPATLRAWWHQRSRWVRGGMQVARKHLAGCLRPGAMPLRKRQSLAHLLLLNLVAPLFLLLPLIGLLGLLGLPARTLLPKPVEAAAWAFVTVTPAVTWVATWMQDRSNGIRHTKREWLALPLTSLYMGLQGVLFANAFLEEFVLREPSAFVKTQRANA